MIALSLERSRTRIEGYDLVIAKSLANGCIDMYQEAGWK